MIVDTDHPLAHKIHVFDDYGNIAGRVVSFDTDTHVVVQAATDSSGSVIVKDGNLIFDTKAVVGWTYTIDGTAPKPI